MRNEKRVQKDEKCHNYRDQSSDVFPSEKLTYLFNSILIVILNFLKFTQILACPGGNIPLEVL